MLVYCTTFFLLNKFAFVFVVVLWIKKISFTLKSFVLSNTVELPAKNLGSLKRKNLLLIYHYK